MSETIENFLNDEASLEEVINEGSNETNFEQEIGIERAVDIAKREFESYASIPRARIDDPSNQKAKFDLEVSDVLASVSGTITVKNGEFAVGGFVAPFDDPDGGRSIADIKSDLTERGIRHAVGEFVGKI